MQVTENLKKKIRAAAAAGYTHVESPRTTHYSKFHTVDALLGMPVGIDDSRYAGENVSRWHARHPEAKTIKYRELFRRF